MAPIKDYVCNTCHEVWEEFIRSKEDIPMVCLVCQSVDIKQAPTAAAGYSFASGSGGGSVTPKGSGSFKRGKK
jgi:hypothetical protein